MRQSRNFKFQISDFRFQISNFKFQISNVTIRNIETKIAIAILKN